VMAKYTNVLGDEMYAGPPRPRMLRTLLLVSVLAVSPLIYEGGLIVYGKWQAMLGTYVEVRTPILDHVAVASQWAKNELKYQSPSFFRDGRLPPMMIVGSVIALAIFGSLFLRKN
jgi:hypothetical protein